MRRSVLSRWAWLWLVGVLASVVAPGCALTDLKEANRRLKESNDRLIAENNRLEQELAEAEKRPESAPTRPAAEAPAVAVADPAPRPSERTSEDLILDGLREEGVVQVDRTAQGVRLTIADRVFFSSGQAQLSQGGQTILGKIARVINRQYPNQLVRVDGHTDDTPIRKVRALYPTNWELSTARACTVVRYLVDRGSVSPRRIFPAGFAYYRPAAAGATANSKRSNRRVEITILNERV
jgi:chemotaxis protein MotB